MHPRISAVATIAGLEPGEAATEEAITKFAEMLMSDVIDMINHVKPDKYDLVSGTARIKQLINDNYDIK